MLLLLQLAHARLCLTHTDEQGVYIPGNGLSGRIRSGFSSGAMGMPAARIVEFAKEALTDSSHPTNPRPMTQGDYEKLIANAM